MNVTASGLPYREVAVSPGQAEREGPGSGLAVLSTASGPKGRASPYERILGVEQARGCTGRIGVVGDGYDRRARAPPTGTMQIGLKLASGVSCCYMR